jgi:hypothetical protein
MRKNEKITFSIILFLLILTIIITPALIPVFGVPGNMTTFNVSLAVNSGTPTITYVQAISDSPNEGTTKLVSFYFNATHPNGVSNIPAGNANVQINQTGTTLTQTGCVVKATDGVSLNMYECNITIYFYTSPGTWTINATITDLAANKATNTTKSYTNGNTYGIVLKTTSVSFSGTPGTNDNAAAQNPQYVNNTGNVAFNYVNLTAYNLQSGANFIGAGNFTANTTSSSGPGHILLNNTAVTLTGSSIAIQGSRDIYIYADIPTGTPNGTYTNINDWRVTVN